MQVRSVLSVKSLQLKSEHEQYINEKNKHISETESRLKQKENSLNQQNSELGRKNKEADAIRENLKAQVEIATKKSEEYEKLRLDAIRQIEEIAGMTAAEAKNQLMESMKAEARTQAQSYINDVMDEARLTASKEAKRIVINTIQRTASETAIENAFLKSYQLLYSKDNTSLKNPSEKSCFSEKLLEMCGCWNFDVTFVGRIFYRRFQL